MKTSLLVLSLISICLTGFSQENFQSLGTKKNLVKVLGRFSVDSAVGFGTSSPSEKLHVAGNLRLVNGSQGVNKVLTSDANGVTSWKSKGYVDVTDYGAIGDGSTDDIISINAAATAAGPSGKIFFPANLTYAISDSILSMYSGQVFSGYGATIKILNIKHGFKIRHDSVSVLGFRIIGNGTSNTSSQEGTAIFIQGASYCKVKDNIISNISSNGIAVVSGASYHAGLRYNASASFNEISGNLITGLEAYTSHSADYSGILMGYADLIPVNNNIISNNVVNGKFTLKHGVGFIGAGNSNIISNNIVKNLREYGILLYSTAGQPDNAIKKNKVSGNIVDSIGSTGTDKGMGIYLQKTVGTSVINNTVSHVLIGASAGSLAQSAITVDGSLDATVVGNKIDSVMTDFPGIYVNSSFNSIVSNNTIADVFLGMRIQNSSYLQAEGNNVLRSRNSAVYITTGLSASSNAAGYASIQTGNSIRIKNNILNSIGAGVAAINYAALNTSPSYFSEVSGNTITTEETGILTTYLLRSSITDNTVIGNSGTGNAIQLNSTNDSNYINHNKIYRTSGSFTTGIYSEGPQNSLSFNKIYNSTTTVSSSSATFDGVYHDNLSLSANSVLGSGAGYGCTSCGGGAYLKLYNPATGNTALQSSTDYALLLNPSGGNVGVGITPTSKLHVVGDVHFDGAQIHKIVTPSDADYTVLDTDYIISLKNWTVNRNVVFPATATTGRVIRLVMGVSGVGGTYSGATLVSNNNIDYAGTLQTGTFVWDGSRWQHIH